MKRKEQKGITLVALVITIVVLLILAGVALSSMQQSGIIEKSKEAKEEYGKASTNEETTLEEYAKYIDDKLNKEDENIITNSWENAGLTKSIVVYEGEYYTDVDYASGWEEVNLKVYENGILQFGYTHGGKIYTGSTTVNNCTVSGNRIHVNTWEEGNISFSTAFEFIVDRGYYCIVDDECYIYY